MRITCTVCVINRQQAHQPLGTNKQANRYLKSTLALCKEPKSERYCIILFSSTHKNGIKYPVVSNISNILTRFIKEGKATVQFKKPEHDIHIQADTLPLKHFLVLLKKVLENTLTSEDMKLSTIDVAPLKHASTKLSIKQRSEYPIRGFPNTLEVLHINDVRRLGFDNGILKLLHLKILDLSNNLIKFLPEQLNTLPCLTDLNMSDNRLGEGAPRQWDWMGGNLSKTLKGLSLTNNQMKYLPQQLIRLHNLITLRVDQNQLRAVPSGIGNLRNLRIFTASDNQLSSFPGSIKKLKLDELDVCSNSFNDDVGEQARNFAAQYPKPLPVLSLREYSSRKVLWERMAYDKEVLPLTLIKYLETARFCVCGKACFDKFIVHKDVLWLESITKALRVSRSAGAFIPIDLYFCSMQCFSCSHRRRVLVR